MSFVVFLLEVVGEQHCVLLRVTLLYVQELLSGTPDVGHVYRLAHCLVVSLRDQAHLLGQSLQNVA